MSVREECYIGPYIKVEPKTILVEREIFGCKKGHMAGRGSKFCSECGEIIGIFIIPTERIEGLIDRLWDTEFAEWFSSVDVENVYIPNHNYGSVFWGVEEGDISPDIIDKEMLLFYANYEGCLNFMKEKGIVFDVKFGFIKYYM